MPHTVWTGNGTLAKVKAKRQLEGNAVTPEQGPRGRLRKPSREYREAFASLELMSAVVSARLRAGYTPTAEELRAEEAAFDRLLHARQAYWASVSKREK